MKKDIPFELSNIIVDARIHAGLTQKELAKRMKTTQANIARAEAGKLEPSITFLNKVAIAVGASLDLPKLNFFTSGTQYIKICSN